MDTRRVSQGEMIAAGAGLILLLSLFLPWIGFEAVAEIPGVEAESESASGWESQNTLDIFLFIVALFAVVPAALSMAGGDPQLPFVESATTFLLASIGTLLTLYVLIDVPDGLERKFGLILATLAVIGVTVGSYMAMQEELGREDYR